jgi:hypothetical protein
MAKCITLADEIKGYYIMPFYKSTVLLFYTQPYSFGLLKYCLRLFGYNVRIFDNYFR